MYIFLLFINYKKKLCAFKNLSALISVWAYINNVQNFHAHQING